LSNNCASPRFFVLLEKIDLANGASLGGKLTSGLWALFPAFGCSGSDNISIIEPSPWPLKIIRIPGGLF
jgi:hypothetical protein